MSKDTLSFVVYMIHACADRWDVKPSAAYRQLQSADCIMDFLVPNYDILHTQSTSYIVENIREYLNTRGIVI